MLEILGASSGPLSAPEIQERLDAAGDRVDPVSVYRVLSCLEENGLAHRVLSTGKFRRCDLDPEADCEREQATHCHHNLVCRLCGNIEELHCPGLEGVVAEVYRTSGFQIEDHNLEFTGLCQSCRRQAPNRR